MAEAIEGASLVAYVPVISAAYLEYYESHEGTPNLFVTDETINGGLRPVRKDLRAIGPDAAAGLLESHLKRPVSTIGMIALRHLAGNGQTLFMPDDDVSRYLVNELGINSDQAVLEPVFLRWNRENIDVNSPITPDKMIDALDLPGGVVRSLRENISDTNDWWRQNAAVATGPRGEILGSARNRYVPSDYAGEIDGDIRSQLNRGSSIEAYNTIHAEAELIAAAARQGTALKGCELYATTFPCPTCAKLIAASGISRLYYLDGYATADGEEVLRASGTELVYVENAGLLALNSSRLKDRPYPVS